MTVKQTSTPLSARAANVAFKGKVAPRGPIRYRKVLRDNINGVTNPAIRRLARRGGVKRISSSTYDATREMLKIFLTTMIRDATIYAEHANRKTVTSNDVLYALKRNGRALYM